MTITYITQNGIRYELRETATGRLLAHDTDKRRLRLLTRTKNWQIATSK